MGLLELPPELFEWIAKYCHSTDLLALRLVCRNAAANVLNIYTATYFTEKVFGMTEAHLRQAVDIAKHPVFGAALKHISFAIDEVRENECRAQDDRWPMTFAYHGLSQEASAMLEEQKHTRDRGADIQLLVYLFCRLKMLGKATAVALGEVRYLLDDTTTGPWVADYHRAPLVTDSRPFNLFIEALALSGWQIEDFDMCTSVDDYKIPIHQILLDDAATKNLSIALSQVGRLELDIWVDKLCDQFKVGTKLGNTLSGMSRLKYLTLWNGFAINAAPAERAASTGELTRGLFTRSFQTLETLELHTFDLRFEHLAEFLHRHSTENKLRDFIGGQLCVGGWQPQDGTSWSTANFQSALEGRTGLGRVSCEECEKL